MVNIASNWSLRLQLQLSLGHRCVASNPNSPLTLIQLVGVNHVELAVDWFLERSNVALKKS